jgi:hypothetical protein
MDTIIGYERIVSADLDDAERWEALAALGYDYAEIQWHLDRPGKLMSQGFA